MAEDVSEENDSLSPQSKEQTGELAPKLRSEGDGAEDGTIPHASAAAQVVHEVAQGVKTAVNEAVAWAEEKVNNLSAQEAGAGPYASPATCVPSDLDPIASGVLPAMLIQKAQNSSTHTGKKQDAPTAGSEGRKGLGSKD